MPLTMPSLHQASSGTLTTTKGTVPIEKINKPTAPVSTTYSGVDNYSPLNNISLQDYQGPSFSNGNPILTSGLATITKNGQTYQIPKALGQVLARESEVNGTRAGLSTLFQNQPQAAGPYLDDTAQRSQLDQMTQGAAQSPAYAYGDTLQSSQDLNSELSQLQAPQPAGQAETEQVFTARQAKIQDIQSRIKALAPTLNDRNLQQNAGKAPGGLGAIRSLLDNWHPTTSNLPIKESVVR